MGFNVVGKALNGPSVGFGVGDTVGCFDASNIGEEMTGCSVVGKALSGPSVGFIGNVDGSAGNALESKVLDAALGFIEGDFPTFIVGNSLGSKVLGKVLGTPIGLDVTPALLGLM